MLAGALGLALACDLIVAKEGASFGTPEINVRMFPFMIMALIYRNVPRKKANELLLLGERISAEEAREAGIVNRVAPAGKFEAVVEEWAQKLAGKSPVLMRLGKDAMRRQLDMPLEDALDFLRSQLCDRLHDGGHPGGRPGVLREARAALDGALRRWRCRWSRCAAGPRTASGRPQGVEILAPLVGEALGVEPRYIGSAGEVRETRFEDDLEGSRGCLLEAGGQIDDALHAGDAPLLLAADCAVSLTTLPAVVRNRPEARLLWLDAHGDYNTPSTTGGGYLGGACASREPAASGTPASTNR